MPTGVSVQIRHLTVQNGFSDKDSLVHCCNCFIPERKQEIKPFLENKESTKLFSPNSAHIIYAKQAIGFVGNGNIPFQ